MRVVSPSGAIYNICSGQPILLTDICRHIHDLIGNDNLIFAFGDSRLGDISKWYGCNRKLIQLGFKPKVTFREGLLTTIKGK